MSKKNFRSIPVRIRNRLRALSVDDIIVARVKRVCLGDAEQYAHLGLRFQAPDIVLTPPPAVPPAGVGLYSKANVEGRQVKRYDLPKYIKSFAFEAPNYGDWSRGSHTVERSHEAYRRDFLSPKELELTVEFLGSPAPGCFDVRFGIDQVLTRTAPDFDDDLLYNLNLLQENVGAADVLPSVRKFAEYRQTVQLDWEMLPPHDLEDVARRILSKRQSRAIDDSKAIKARIAAFSRFNPMRYLAGTSGFLRYMGAQFQEDLIVLENINYSSALFVMTDSWQELSRRSRIDLLKAPREGFERIELRKRWETQLQGVLQRRVRRPPIGSIAGA